MGSKAVGMYILAAGFFVIGAMLYCANYVAAASQASVITSWPTEVGRVGEAVRQFSSGGMTGAAVVACVVGVVLVVLGEVRRG